MIIYSFSDADFLRTRFGISPLNELMQSVAALRDPSRAALHVPWLRAATGRLDGLDIARLKALVPAQGYQPDFVAPPPRTPVPDVAEEIDRVRRTRPQQVRFELAEAYGRRLPAVLRPLLDRPRKAIEELADLLERYWERAIAPYWEAIREVLEADIAHRARLLTTGGPIEVFDQLHPQVRWRDSALEVERDYEQIVELSGRGIMLIPSVFVWPRSGALWDPPWQPALIYPARGAANLWAPVRRDPRALGALIGHRRATILLALGREATTSSIARRLDVSPASISEHLSVLRRAGLVRHRRDGREVFYQRTPAGDTLIRAPHHGARR